MDSHHKDEEGLLGQPASEEELGQEAIDGDKSVLAPKGATQQPPEKSGGPKESADHSTPQENVGRSTSQDDNKNRKKRKRMAKMSEDEALRGQIERTLHKAQEEKKKAQDLQDMGAEAVKVREEAVEQKVMTLVRINQRRLVRIPGSHNMGRPEVPPASIPEELEGKTIEEIEKEFPGKYERVVMDSPPLSWNVTNDEGEVMETLKLERAKDRKGQPLKVIAYVDEKGIVAGYICNWCDPGMKIAYCKIRDHPGWNCKDLCQGDKEYCLEVQQGRVPPKEHRCCIQRSRKLLKRDKAAKKAAKKGEKSERKNKKPRLVKAPWQLK